VYNITILNNKGVPFMTVTDQMLNDTMGMIHNMNPDQIASVVDAIKLRRNRINKQSINTIQVGDRVQFVGRGGSTVKGSVTKKAIKFVTVDTGSVKWKVPANMLEVL
jgi:fructoselysine-6-P-deglycase FrlB-like protein